MSYFLECRLEGLAGRSTHYAQVLNRDVNVFFGGNGVGKTTLLRTLYSAMRKNSGLLTGVALTGASVTFFTEDHQLEVVRSLHRSRSDAKDHQELKLFAQTEPDELELDLMVDPRQSKWNWQTTVKAKESRSLSSKSFRCAYLPVSRLYTSSFADPRLWRVSQEGLDPASLEPKLESSFVSHVQVLWKGYANKILSEVGQAQQLGLSRILNTVLSTTRKVDAKATASDPDAAYQLALSFLKRQPGFRSGIGSKKQSRNIILRGRTFNP